MHLIRHDDSAQCFRHPHTLSWTTPPLPSSMNFYDSPLFTRGYQPQYHHGASNNDPYSKLHRFCIFCQFLLCRDSTGSLTMEHLSVLFPRAPPVLRRTTAQDGQTAFHCMAHELSQQRDVLHLANGQTRDTSTHSVQLRHEQSWSAGRFNARLGRSAQWSVLE